MLSWLEQKRQEIGLEELSRDGITISHTELYQLFDDYKDEFIKNYNMRGHVYAYGNTSFEITDGYPDYIVCDWCTGRVVISRKDSKGHYTSDVALETERYKDARIQVFYSEFNWIDIHISPSKDNFDNAICLCLPPRI